MKRRTKQETTSLLTASLATATDLLISGVDADLARRLAATPETPSCYACRTPWCCYQATMISVIEALRIASRYAFTDDEIRHMHRVGEMMEQVSREQYFAWSIPCPWLIDDRCAVYADRPIACRLHYVATPVEHCCPTSSEPMVGHLNVLDIELHALATALTIEQMFFGGCPTPMICAGPRAVALTCDALSTPDPIAYLERQSWMDLDRISTILGAQP